jgi:dihydroxyacetone kinase phosphotransfer subunit
MVGIVVVSHSPALARAAVNLALQMVQGSAPRIEIAAGTSDDRFGTDAARVVEAIIAADEGDGVVVIMDLGSAVLSAELALELLPDSDTKIRLVPAAFVEGIFAAVVSAAGVLHLTTLPSRPTRPSRARRRSSCRARLRRKPGRRSSLGQRSSLRQRSSIQMASMRDPRPLSSMRCLPWMPTSRSPPTARRQFQRAAQPR